MVNLSQNGIAVFICFPNVDAKSIPHTGHSAVLLIDSETGQTRCYEYTRSGDKRGVVMYYPTPNVEIGRDGEPSSESLRTVLGQVALKCGELGKGRLIKGAYIKTNRLDKMDGYAQIRLLENSNPKRKKYSALHNNCAHFACNVISQDETLEIFPFIDPRPVSVIKKFIDVFPEVSFYPKTGVTIRYKTDSRGLGKTQGDIVDFLNIVSEFVRENGKVLTKRKADRFISAASRMVESSDATLGELALRMLKAADRSVKEGAEIEITGIFRTLAAKAGKVDETSGIARHKTRLRADEGKAVAPIVEKQPAAKSKRTIPVQQRLFTTVDDFELTAPPVDRKTRTRRTTPKTPGGAAPVQTFTNECGPFAMLPLGLINTDEARFQNRGTAYSEASAARVALQYNPNLFDPIVVWLDTTDSKIYVLSGHSRLEGMRRRQADKIAVRFFDGSEQEAIKFAHVDANRAASPETLVEDIKAYRLIRDGDESRGVKPQSKQELKLAFKNATKLEFLSYLNENGLFLKALTNILEKQIDVDTPRIQLFSQWLGEIRRTHPEFTDIHERDVFYFLYSGDASGAKLDKEHFDNIVLERLALGRERLFPECDPENGCAKAKDIESLFRTQAEKKLARELVDAEKELRELKERLNAKAFTRSIKTSEEKVALRTLIEDKQAEISRIRQNLNLAEEMQSAPSLFGARKRKK